MSFCRAEDIGEDANASDVEAVAGVLNWWGVRFYDPQVWYMPTPSVRQIAKDTYQVDAMRKVIKIDSVIQQSAFRTPVDIPVVEIDGRIVTLTMKWGYTQDLKFTGVIGNAIESQLSVGDELKVGDTILRDGATVFFTADDTALADDILLSPPALLREIAKTIGRRLVNRALDEGPDNIQTSVLEDMREELRAYR